MAAWWSRNRQRVVQLVGTSLAIVLLVYLLREDGWNEIVAAMRQIQIVNLFWVALLFLVSRIAVAARWHVLLKSAGVNIRFKDSTMLTFTGLFASNFLPTTIGGDVLRLAGAMRMGYDRAVCLASIAADRLIGMFGMFTVAPIGLFYSWNILTSPSLSVSLMAFMEKTLAFLKRTFSTFSIGRAPAILGVYMDPYALLVWSHLSFSVRSRRPRFVLDDRRSVEPHIFRYTDSDFDQWLWLTRAFIYISVLACCWCFAGH